MSPISANRDFDWAVAQRALPGQGVSGDQFLVEPNSRGVLFAVVDGVGHGPEATRASEAAVAVLRRMPDASVHKLVNSCHEALRATRGAVMTLVSYDARDRTITWLGVGNVEGHLIRASGSKPPFESALLRGGLVGDQLPTLYASVVPLRTDDLLILASDGIRSGFERIARAQEPSQPVADRILQQFFKGTDDALVLVARYIGSENG